MSDRERLNTLTRTFPLPRSVDREILLELVEDARRQVATALVKACALYTASGISNAELEAVIAATVTNSSDGEHDDEHIVHETLAGLKLSADQVHEVGS